MIYTIGGRTMISRQCGPLLKQLNDVLTKRVNHELKDEDLTVAQMRVLLFLDNHEEKQAPLKELERGLSIAQPTAVGLCRRLKEKNFISYFPDPKNHRAKWVVLTVEGKRKCAIAYTHMQETEQQLLSGMTEEEKKDFYILLQKALLAVQK